MKTTRKKHIQNHSFGLAQFSKEKTAVFSSGVKKDPALICRYSY